VLYLFLENRGFAEVPSPGETIPVWKQNHLHRKPGNASESNQPVAQRQQDQKH
jgi:hypothetical protein